MVINKLLILRLTAKIHVKYLKIGKFVVEYKKQLVNISCCTLSNEELSLCSTEDTDKSRTVAPYLMGNCFKIINVSVKINICSDKY